MLSNCQRSSSRAKQMRSTGPRLAARKRETLNPCQAIPSACCNPFPHQSSPASVNEERVRAGVLVGPPSTAVILKSLRQRNVLGASHLESRGAFAW